MGTLAKCPVNIRVSYVERPEEVRKALRILEAGRRRGMLKLVEQRLSNGEPIIKR